MINAIGVIPARWNSSRFPGKPLADICGIPMVERVYNAAKKSDYLKEVVVATDDLRIVNHCIDYHINYKITSNLHETGTDRIWEIVRDLDYQYVVNIQGDEPLLKPYMIDEMLCNMIDYESDVATMALMLRKKYDFIKNPNMVKVLVDEDGFATGFYRIVSNFYQNQKMNYPNKHIGIYAYKKHILKEFKLMQQTENEKELKLEQLRFLENSYPIHVTVFDEHMVSVDVPEDVDKIRNLFLKGKIKWH